MNYEQQGLESRHQIALLVWRVARTQTEAQLSSTLRWKIEKIVSFSVRDAVEIAVVMEIGEATRIKFKTENL